MHRQGDGQARHEPMLSVSHPAAGLHLVRVQSPILELLLEQGAADVGGIVEFARSVVVEDLAEDGRMAVEEVLIEDGIEVC